MKAEGREGMPRQILMNTGAVHMQCWKHFCCKTAIILAYIEFKNFGIEILEINRKS